VADTVIQLAYDEAVRAIDSQASTLESLRSRAGTLLSAASLVTGFLGGLALASPTLVSGEVVRGKVGVPAWFAIGAFIGVAVFALLILLPYKFRFEMSAEKILKSRNLGFDDYQAALAGFHDANRIRNKKRITNLLWSFRLACLFLVVETVFWVLELT
jgi:hypothetical protein